MADIAQFRHVVMRILRNPTARRDIVFVSVSEVIDSGEGGYATPYNNRPVETGRIWVGRRWEADHDHAQAEEQQSKSIDEVARNTQVPPRRLDRV